MTFVIGLTDMAVIICFAQVLKIAQKDEFNSNRK